MKTLIAAGFFIVSTITITTAQTKDNVADFEKLIIEAYQTEQKNRTLFIKLFYDKSTPQDSIKKYGLQMNEGDKENQRRVFPILDKYLANEILLSDSALHAAYYIVQHADIEDQEKYADFVENLFKNKVINANEYTRFVDRVLVRNGKAQIYLKQSFTDADMQDAYPYPVRADAKEIAKKNNLLHELEKELTNEKWKGDYALQFITEDEFVVFGHVTIKKDQKNTPVSGVEVSHGGKVLARTNSNGFYSFKITKSNATGDVSFNKDGTSVIKKLDSNNKDFQNLYIRF